jgi:hypothetical protein
MVIDNDKNLFDNYCSDSCYYSDISGSSEKDVNILTISEKNN